MSSCDDPGLTQQLHPQVYCLQNVAMHLEALDCMGSFLIERQSFAPVAPSQVGGMDIVPERSDLRCHML